MHLQGEQLERYQQRDLPQPLLSALDLHIGSCLCCSRSLAQSAASAERWERRGFLGRLVRVGEPLVDIIAVREEEVPDMHVAA